MNMWYTILKSITLAIVWYLTCDNQPSESSVLLDAVDPCRFFKKKLEAQIVKTQQNKTEKNMARREFDNVPEIFKGFPLFSS